jgi:hypothetical protein
MCERKYLYSYNALGNGVLRTLSGFIKKNLLNCSIPHCSLSNFQGEEFEKVKLDRVGVLLLSSHIHD